MEALKPEVIIIIRISVRRSWVFYDFETNGLNYYHNQNTNLNVESMYYLNYFYNDVKFNRNLSIYSLQKLSDL